MKKKRMLAFLLGGILFSLPLFSFEHFAIDHLRNAPTKLTQIILEHIDNMEEQFAMNASMDPHYIPKQTKNPVYFYFSRFQTRIEPFVVFGSSHLLNLKIYPVVEVEIWRDIPEGWEPFIP